MLGFSVISVVAPFSSFCTIKSGINHNTKSHFLYRSTPTASLANVPSQDMKSKEIAWDPDAKLPPLAVGFQTCEEVKQDIQLEVIGEIPKYVIGRLFRNGPGVFEVTHANGDVQHMNHWFDGISVVHRFIIDGTTGTVYYKNRRTSPKVIELMEAAPSHAEFKAMSFGNQDPCRGVLGKLFQMWKPFTKHPKTDEQAINISVTLERIPGVGPLVARTDFNRAAVLDIDTLDVTRELGFEHLNPQLSGSASAAHGVVDPDNGSYVNCIFEYGPDPEYNIMQISNNETKVLAKFKEKPVYMHSIAATKNFVIIMIYSVPINVLKIPLGETSFLECLKFDEKMRTKFYVISKNDGGVKAVYDTDAFFCFHQINAFEQDDDVVVDLGLYENADIMKLLYRSQIINAKSTDAQCKPSRFVLKQISTAAKAYNDDGKPVASVKPALLADIDLELMRVAPSVEMKPYRFTYGVTAAGVDTHLFNSLVKIDVTNGGKVFYTPESAACGEPIFISDPNGTHEDDGVLLSVVLDLQEAKSYLAIVDARSMCEVARASVPQAVPLGFHGQYMTEQFVQESRVSPLSM